MEPEIHQKLVDARLTALEAEVRRLRVALGWPIEEPAESDPATAEAATDPGTGLAAPAGASAGPPPRPPTSTTTAPPGDPTRPVRQARTRPTEDFERWFGENALLVVGLIALVATAGFLIKYAFDQGWISPAFRVIAGLVAGLGVAVYGDHAQRRGLIDFGSALVGGGGAIAYVSIWAAAGPYQFIPPAVGVACLAAISGMVIVSATASATQYLAALAAVGAFMAPMLLGDPDSAPETLLVYTVAVSAACGFVALRREWQATFGLVALGFYFLPVLGAWDASMTLLTGYLVAGTAGGLWLAQERGWHVSLALIFTFGWLLLAAHAEQVEGASAWLTVALLPAVALPTWLDHLRGGPGEPATERRAPDVARQIRSAWWGLFLLAAFAWTGATAIALPEPLDGLPLAALGALALPYLWLAHSRQAPGPALIGFGILAWGIAGQLDGPLDTAGWAVLAVLSTALTRPAAMALARWGALLLGLLAAGQLFDVDLVARAQGAPALTDPWSLVLYLVVAAFVLPAGPLWGEPPDEADARHAAILKPALWILAGLVVLVGGTLEIGFAFEAELAAGRELGHDLTVSAFWIIYAGALLAYGFWRDRRGVRIAGLVVTVFAIIKIVFHDLTQLEALYRVGALGLLAVIALLAARAYHRRREPHETTEDPS